MATYKPTFTINDDQMIKITDYLSYQAELPDPEDEDKTIPNPQGRPLFLLGKVKDYLRACYKAQLAKELDVTKAETLAEADTDTIDVTN